MKIVTITWARNESDILEAFVRHHAAFADRMVIVDHRSQDNSCEILAQLKREGLPLEIRHDPRFGHLQADVLTAIAQEVAQRDDPDWILPLDADEFLVTTDGRSIVEAFGGEDTAVTLRIPWRTYVPRTSDNPQEPHVLRRITHRKSREHPVWRKIALPRAVLRNTPKLTIAPGNHAAENGGGTLQTKESGSLALAHFPVRSTEQITRKVVGGWLSSRLNGKNGQNAYFQWRVLYDELRAGKRLTPADLTSLGLRYATNQPIRSMPPLHEDPVPTSSTLRYPIRSVSPWEVLLKSAEGLAEEYAELTRKQVTRERGISTRTGAGKD